MIDILKNVPLADKTTFRIGGEARFFVAVNNDDELKEALEYAKHNSLEFFILGGGSNVLFSDKGFSGLVVKIKNAEFLIHNSHIEVGAGVPLSKLVRDCSG